MIIAFYLINFYSPQRKLIYRTNFIKRMMIMKIVDVRSVILRQPTVEMIGDGSQDTIVILIDTDEGITGIGEVDSAPDVVKSIINMPASHMACMGLKELLIGEDPLDVERLWRKMYSKSIYYGRRSAAIHAMSGIDLALWDIIGKKLGITVGKALGGTYRNRIQAYCSVLMPGTEAEIEELVSKHMSKGYQGMKLGWGALGESFEKDIRLVKAARKTLGPNKKLMIDIGMRWTDVKSGRRKPASARLLFTDGLHKQRFFIEETRRVFEMTMRQRNHPSCLFTITVCSRCVASQLKSVFYFSIVCVRIRKFGLMSLHLDLSIVDATRISICSFQGTSFGASIYLVCSAEFSWDLIPPLHASDFLMKLLRMYFFRRKP